MRCTDRKYARAEADWNDTTKPGLLPFPVRRCHPCTSSGALQTASDDFKLGTMILQLKRSDDQESALKQRLNDQQNPKSSEYHHWLTPDKFGAQFGIAEQDINTVTAWLQSHGFTVESVAKGRNQILFSGTQAQLRDAFHTEMRSYMIHGNARWANASEIQIPESLAPVISGIASLNSIPSHAAHTQPVLMQKDTSTGKWKAHRSANEGHTLR